MKVVAFLPAKGTSSRIENKNTKLLDGKPLFLHTLEKLATCDFIDEVYLDSESDEIFELADNVDCHFLKRDSSLATNATDGHSLFYNEAIKAEADIYIQILGTSPFIKSETIKKGIDILLKDFQYDSVVLVKKDKQYLWENGQPLYSKDKIPNSIDLPDTIIETMGLYIVRREVVLEQKKRFGNNTFFLEASAIEAIDVNYPDEFELANFIAAGIREKERQLFKNLANKLTSSMLSDILDDLNLDTTITSLSLNLRHKKMLGRAKTLKIRALKKGEDFKGIYDALSSYETIVPNDIIIVENECSDFAYFGEMNANLAIRSGAIGAIIGGKTRDTKEVADLDFPVFSTGAKCKDVRKRATLESVNKKITLFGVVIHPNDLVFADNDGIIVIPKKYEATVLQKAFETISKEKNILTDISKGISSNQIIQNNGEF
ncbi:cytidylyltransferase domain-containing protein [Sulfurospirillum cavolei]|uniref:RraA family protein n=1 Tax=Sulfurospirillum cavolei TaxID=366522 RepID=UPI0005A7C251|nr:cytidyltransferase [Sulfurospirillum cavolei]